MTSDPSPALHPAAARSLEVWHRMVSSRDLSDLSSIVHPEAVFRSPMAHKPYASAAALQLVLGTVINVFQDFRYHRQLSSASGRDVVLEFSARVGDRELKGIDMIHFDEHGLIREFEVMVRPMSGLEALGEEMGRRLAATLPGYAQATGTQAS